MLSPVPGPTSAPSGRPSSRGRRCTDGAGGLGRAEHVRQHATGRARHRAVEHLVAIVLVAGRPPAGPRGVAAVGGAAPAEALGEPVVRQADRARGRGDLGLGAPQPGPARDGERGHRHHADALRPGSAPSPSRSSAASGAERVSFHSTAGRSGRAVGVRSPPGRAAGRPPRSRRPRPPARSRPAPRAAPPTRPRDRSRAPRRCRSTSCGRAAARRRRARPAGSTTRTFVACVEQSTRASATELTRARRGTRLVC